jgi:hypothetical protein
MTVEDKIKASETRIFKAVFPNTTNHYDTLFGEIIDRLREVCRFLKAQKFQDLVDHRVIFEDHILFTSQNKNAHQEKRHPVFFIHGD